MRYFPIYFNTTDGAVPPVNVSKLPRTLNAGLPASKLTVVAVQTISAAEMLNHVTPSRVPCKRYVQVAGAPVTISSIVCQTGTPRIRPLDVVVPTVVCAGNV